MFDDNNGGYTAKVADFGYSGLSLERSEDSAFHLPISRPWNSPEVNEWDSTLPFFAARKADIYSFGMLSIWILFCHYFPKPENAPNDNDTETDLELLQVLKDDDLLFSFAMQCAESEKNLTEEQMNGLALFFSWTLTADIYTRRLPNEYHEAAEKTFFEHKNALSPTNTKERKMTEPKVPTLTSLGIMWTDIEGYQRPFGYLQ